MYGHISALMCDPFHGILAMFQAYAGMIRAFMTGMYEAKQRAYIRAICRYLYGHISGQYLAQKPLKKRMEEQFMAIHMGQAYGPSMDMGYEVYIQAVHPSKTSGTGMQAKNRRKKSEGAASPREARDYSTRGPSGQAAPLHPASFP